MRVLLYEPLLYEHQIGRCPTTVGTCPGHRTRRTKAAIARINALRDAGNLAYLGPAPRRRWWPFATKEH